MFGLTDLVGRATGRAASMAAVCLLALSAGTIAAKSETRTLKFYNLHTKEKVAIAYKKNGRYSSEALKQIDWFMRDWRTKQPTKMDPRLLDLVWEAYRQSGSRAYMNVICGYRSPATNNMLRSRSSGVAKESQHTLGRALDFSIPDVPLKKMREIGLKMQVGGVGYYPRSGSPFVHFDVGNARHWPRMSRKELVAVFPNGNTVHVPSDGKPLPGYKQALASYKSRKGSSAVQVANAGSGGSGGGKTLLAALFGGGADEENDVADVEVAAKAAAPAKKSAPTAAPKPREDVAVAVAAMAPAAKPNLLATGVPLPIRDTFDTSVPRPPSDLPPSDLPQAREETEVAALDLSRIPLPRAAPGRQVPAVPAAAGIPSDPTLVASLNAAPAPETGSVDASAQLAYAVPTPRRRPLFETLLQGEPELAAAAAETEVAAVSAPAAPPSVPSSAEKADEIRRIVEASAAMRADVMGQPKAVLPSGRPSPAPQKADQLLLAALQTPTPAGPAVSLPARPAKSAVPQGKTGRIARVKAPAPAPLPPRSQQVLASRFEMATLVAADPSIRAAKAVGKKPNADVLVRDVPSSVFTAGFAPEPVNPASDRFVGSAVNFLPVAKFQ